MRWYILSLWYCPVRCKNPSFVALLKSTWWLLGWLLLPTTAADSVPSDHRWDHNASPSLRPRRGPALSAMAAARRRAAAPPAPGSAPSAVARAVRPQRASRPGRRPLDGRALQREGARLREGPPHIRCDEPGLGMGLRRGRRGGGAPRHSCWLYRFGRWLEGLHLCFVTIGFSRVFGRMQVWQSHGVCFGPCFHDVVLIALP